MPEPEDVQVEEYGMTLYTPGAELPRTSKLHHCHCGAWHWLPSDGSAQACRCGTAWAQRPVGVVTEVIAHA